MTDLGIDVAQLTEEQQLALQQFTSVTDQPLEAAAAVLQRCQWNAQIAITRFFDGDSEVVDPATEALAIPPPQTSRRQETLLDSIPGTSRSARHLDLQSAPRIVPQPESQVTQQAPWLLSIIFMPFNFAYTIVARIFGTVGYLFPFLPRLLARLSASNSSSARRRDTSGRRPLSPRDTAARFIREFEEEYGSHELPFTENGYAQAFDLAKRELKYLLVVLLSPEHDDTSSFVRDTLLSPQVVEFIKKPENNIVLWAGSVQDAEAYQVSNALNCTKFPFVGLIVHTPSVSSTSMSLVARVAGPTLPAQFLAKFGTAISQNNEALVGIRATRAEQAASRRLREDQNSAYERSLAQDRARAQQRRETEAAREIAEKEAKERAEAAEREASNLQQWRTWRAQSIPSEPGPEVRDAVRISVRLPSGERAIRKFRPEADIEELYAWVECYELLQNKEEMKEEEVQEPERYQHAYRFRLVSPIPREVYNLHAGGSVKERIGRSGNLIVEPIDEDEDDG
ncbi:hypothetical protein B0A49_10036 [Cryomyces minteri]|uniref:UBX domain-containing protein n=1 Tax=Cryomyces minteri TaxID=331657 RepID=A0A4U0W2R4_9PEZI|nr:hypothetical protein B0A49_12899 [Cryomyces minteri]TKA58741.1 hypothetical protein B0A49_12750 [Cryomyces minteri]TKA66382.1 hypothetical protein B0A49_10036 [Cryomyces minteri]